MDLIKDFWALAAALVGGIFWLARLEGKVAKSLEEIERLEKRIERDRADMRDDLSDVKELLAEQNRDIKILLGRGHQIHWNDRTQPPR
ncbi:hypothetical protein [Paracoccus aminovorans]|uniref:hypothetical protein n=1 Tax=Paracoccus aminovorans TaxID=34004 RepID=UPI0007861A54|nr:hypothetical protein [Paracoccus aminovorans]